MKSNNIINKGKLAEKNHVKLLFSSKNVEIICIYFRTTIKVRIKKNYLTIVYKYIFAIKKDVYFP